MFTRPDSGSEAQGISDSRFDRRGVGHGFEKLSGCGTSLVLGVPRLFLVCAHFRPVDRAVREGSAGANA